MVDTWTVGRFEQPGRRVGRALAWLRSDLTGDNGYARPIGGLIALVDLNDMQVIRIDDHGALPVPEEHGDYRERWRAPRIATICGRSRSPSRRARASRSTATRSAGARGACASASTRASR